MSVPSSGFWSPCAPRGRLVLCTALIWGALAIAMGSSLVAQEETPSGSSGPAPSEEGALALQQTGLVDRYARLEKLLFDLSALEAAENPRRAALLKQAFQQSADKLTRRQLENVSQLLVRRDYGRAVDEQGVALQDLKQLLELLQSENRPDRLRSEQERIREYIKELDRLIRLQGSVQGRTEGGVDMQKLVEEQARVAERAAELARRIQATEEPSSEGQAGEGEAGEEGQAGESGAEDQEGGEAGKSAQPGESEESAGDQPDGDPANADGENAGKSEGQAGPSGDERKEGTGENGADGEKSESSEEADSAGKDPAEKSSSGEEETGKGAPGEGEPQEGQPNGESGDGGSSGEPGESPENAEPGSPGESGPSGDMPSGEPGESEAGDGGQSSPAQQSPAAQENPARKRIQAAEDRMREAQRKLEEAKRGESLEEQEKAREELMKAKAELEEILRQMREEEVERMLSLLESRFRRMLEMQLKVYESTKRLDRIAKEDRGRDFVILANNLSGEEQKISLEAERALLLLQEEGSSIAFPESVDQIRREMDRVTEFLAKGNVGLLTQESEEDVIASLEEMIKALQQAQREQEERQQQQESQQQQGGSEDPPLVDQLAELRMIRALQMRVNTRTQRFARLLADADDPVGQAEDDELIEALEHLSGREAKILQITRDILLEKNK